MNTNTTPHHPHHDQHDIHAFRGDWVPTIPEEEHDDEINQSSPVKKSPILQSIDMVPTIETVSEPVVAKNETTETETTSETDSIDQITEEMSAVQVVQGEPIAEIPVVNGELIVDAGEVVETNQVQVLPEATTSFPEAQGYPTTNVSGDNIAVGYPIDSTAGNSNNNMYGPSTDMTTYSGAGSIQNQQPMQYQQQTPPPLQYQQQQPMQNQQWVSNGYGNTTTTIRTTTYQPAIVRPNVVIVEREPVVVVRRF